VNYVQRDSTQPVSSDDCGAAGDKPPPYGNCDGASAHRASNADRGPAPHDRASANRASAHRASNADRGPADLVGRGLVPRRALLLPLFLALLFISNDALAKTRLKELVDVQGMRDNELFGYGLVVGLTGTGDTEQVLFTSQSIAGMLGRLGVRIDPRDIRSRNVAAVMVTARQHTYARPGSRLDITVSSMGNARSLAGGVLLITPLAGPDGAVYAVAQGPVQVGGYEASAAGSMVRKNQTTSGRVPGGATVERAVTPTLPALLTLALKRPDFANASRVAAAIEASLGKGSARALDPAAIEVKATDEQKADLVGLVAKLEDLEIEVDQRARVVVSERTGTVVIGDRVRLRPAAVAHGGLRVSIAQKAAVSQPAPFARVGSTVVANSAEVDANEGSRAAVALPAAASVDELVKALNLLGATPRDLIAILQALAADGALDAELEVI
jgi:flagellar P-ring protein precursor FlgI